VRRESPLCIAPGGVFVSSMKGHGEMYQTDIQVKLDFFELQDLCVATSSNWEVPKNPHRAWLGGQVREGVVGLG
jgi:hypothetical protein